MANNPQPKDPTEQALNAIEEALRFNDDVQRPADLTPSHDLSATRELRAGREEEHAPPAGPDLFVEEQRPWAGDETPLRPANDDRATIGQILQTLRRRPSRAPYLVATIATVLWIAGAVAAGLFYAGRLASLFATPNVGFAAAVALAAGFVIPVIFFYVLAHLMRRSQDMRLVAESMAEVAMRLAQPETAGHDAVVTVGQAVRREVAAMGDGIERALARAGELESLVHNEVSALERTYSDNEVRMRDLLTELASQRETLVAQAEQVRNAIASVHLDLANDITSVGDLVADKVNEVALRVTRSLTEKGEHIALALGHAGDSMIDLLGERGATLLDRLENTSERATGAITTASDKLTNSLTFKTETVHNEFAELAVSLQKMMSARLEAVAQGFAKNTAQTIETLATRSQAFTAALDDTTEHLSDTLRVRSDEVNARLRTIGESLANDIGLRGSEAVAKMEQTGARVTETLVNSSTAVADAFHDNAAALVETLNTRGDAVRDILASRLQDFENVFQHSGTALSEKIGRDTATLGGLITRSLADFDHTVKDRKSVV